MDKRTAARLLQIALNEAHDAKGFRDNLYDDYYRAAQRFIEVWGAEWRVELPLRFQNHVPLMSFAKESFLHMAKNDRPKWQGFININLTDADADHFHGWCAELGDDWQEAAKELTEKGYRLSLSWDTKSQCFMMSMTCQSAEEKNAGWCITSRSRDAHETLLMSLYKHFVVCDGDWTQYQKSSGFGWG